MFVSLSSIPLVFVFDRNSLQLHKSSVSFKTVFSTDINTDLIDSCLRGKLISS